MNIIFAGTPQFAAQALEALHQEHCIAAVLTQPDRPAGRGMQLAASPVKQLALQYGLPVLQPATLRSEAAQQTIASLDADVMVVAAYGLILPKQVLQLPRYGCLNIHASLLPRWRGAAPIPRAILAGDRETGITIMQMDEGLDTGDMLLRRACPIAEKDNAETLHDQLATMGAACIVDALRQIEQLTPVKQDGGAACYAAKLLKSEAEINWHNDARHIERAVRAFNPFPVCHAEFNNTTLKIWQTALQIGVEGEPGRVLQADKRGILVACGKDGLLLEVLQRPGGKMLPAAQFMQAMPVKAGDHFAVN